MNPAWNIAANGNAVFSALANATTSPTFTVSCTGIANAASTTLVNSLDCSSLHHAYMVHHQYRHGYAHKHNAQWNTHRSNEWVVLRRSDEFEQ